MEHQCRLVLDSRHRNRAHQAMEAGARRPHGLLEQPVGAGMHERHAAEGDRHQPVGKTFQERIGRSDDTRRTQHGSRQAERIEGRDDGSGLFQPQPCRDQRGAREIRVEGVEPVELLQPERPVRRGPVDHEPRPLAVRQGDDHPGFLSQAECPLGLDEAIPVEQILRIEFRGDDETDRVSCIAIFEPARGPWMGSERRLLGDVPDHVARHGAEQPVAVVQHHAPTGRARRSAELVEHADPLAGIEGGFVDMFGQVIVLHSRFPWQAFQGIRMRGAPHAAVTPSGRAHGRSPAAPRAGSAG